MPDQDPETMPLEELMALANAEAPSTEEVFEVADPAAPVAQPRNADGTFASTTPAVEAPAVPEVIPEPTSFSRTIDLGDGSGAQVFTAATKDELLDKLADAQKHATRKIRELNQVAKQVPKTSAKKELTADEEYLLGQRLISEPSKAYRELAEAEYGMPFEDIKTAMASARETIQGNLWVAQNPDFYNSAENGTKLKQFINRFCEGGITQANLDRAYSYLNEEGRLASKPVAAPPAPVVAAPAPPAPPRARASSLSSRISTLAPPPTGHTEADMWKMPMHELEALANGHKL